MTPLPAMPRGLERLADLAANLWWSWHSEARDLFRSLDETLWRRTRHSPLRFLREIEPERLERAASDPEIRRRYEAVMKAFDQALRGRTHWCHERHPEIAEGCVAYFSAEYGLHNSLPLYAGGLGVLAGDVAKEASDLGVPLTGVGFMYPLGYFRQHVNAQGRQEEVYERIDRDQAPVFPARDQSGNPLRIQLTLPDRTLYIAVWTVFIGRTVLYLMDTGLDENAPGDRELTGRLYGGDQNARVLQEIILGVGGVRALRALGIDPVVWHGNEGHTSMMMIERMREKLAAGMEFDRALEEVRATTVFTTHTPVAAGHDAFSYDLVRGYFKSIEGYGEALDRDRERLFGLAAHPAPWGTAFNMTALALRLSAHANAVSQKHGEVSRAMWATLWPDQPAGATPIRSVTNGVHVPTWTAGEVDRLFRKHIAENWIDRHDEAKLWEKVSKIPDDVLWETRRRLKAGLFHFLHDRIRERWAARDLEADQAVAFGSLLEPDALTLGFARRFASYKRATLILRDPDRLRAMLDDLRRPVQIVFAGKAHPADEGGKDLLQAVYRAARDPAFAGRIAFLEDYDMHAAHWLVQGVDVWLNNPRPPLEASGTSGMKAGLNGVPSLSVLDGWWIEGYDETNGWSFGGSPDGDEGDARDANELYETLEKRIVPLYYDRGADGIPRGWLPFVRRIMQTTIPAFSARRMMKDYVTHMYAPAAAPSETKTQA